MRARLIINEGFKKIKGVEKVFFALFFLLILVNVSFLVHSTEAQGTPAGTLEFEVPVYGSYLRADPFLYGPTNGKPVELPLIVDLAANGLQSGDRIMISYDGILYPGFLWDGDSSWNRTREGLLISGVFSSTSQLGPTTDLNRVTGAIPLNTETQSTVETPKTNFGNQPTDIPEDFNISPYTGMEIQIPLGSRYLLICHPDSYYPDNWGSITINIEKDTDGDGLPDSWETNGIDVDRDGQIDLHLPALGADWERKDIFVEIDYMGSSGTHNHRPNQDALNDVIQAFNSASVPNPDSSYGINLHLYIDEALPHTDTITWQEFDQLKSSHFGTAAERTNPNNIEAKKQVFHYCIFAHSQEGTTSGGSGEMPGNDFMVTLGDWTDQVGTRNEQAATFMHELGHNLGLHHGGADDINYKPNYISIMNYLFQIDDYNTGRALDYSIGHCIALNETNLDETDGIGSADKTIWVSPNGTLRSSGGYYEIDWNLDGALSDSVSVNLNNHIALDYASPAEEYLTDHDDWSNLVYRFRNTPSFAYGQHPELPEEELTLEVSMMMRQQASSIVHATPDVVPSATPASTAVPAGFSVGYIYGTVAAIFIVIIAIVAYVLIKRK